MPDTMMPHSATHHSATHHSATLDALLSRASVPARLMIAPGPDAAALHRAVAAALCAPDHGTLRPSRYVFIEGEARQRLGELLADSLARRAPETPAERLQLEREKPLRAPLVVAVGAALTHDRAGVPTWEQEATVAAGAMNFLNALDLQGFAGIWLSSPSLGDPAVKTALGFKETDSLLGWIYAGTPPAERPVPSRPDPAGFMRAWTGPA